MFKTVGIRHTSLIREDNHYILNIIIEIIKREIVRSLRASDRARARD